MSLFAQSKDILAYLVSFREQAATPAAPSFTVLQNDLNELFSRLTNQRPDLFTKVGTHKMVRYALSAMADQTIAESGWEHAPKWKKNTLEEKFFGRNSNGNRFLEITQENQSISSEVTAIFYLCLALGYHGPYSPEDPRLLGIKKSLLARLPSYEEEEKAPEPTFFQPKKSTKNWRAGAITLGILSILSPFLWINLDFSSKNNSNQEMTIKPLVKKADYHSKVELPSKKDQLEKNTIPLPKTLVPPLLKMRIAAVKNSTSHNLLTLAKNSEQTSDSSNNLAEIPAKPKTKPPKIMDNLTKKPPSLPEKASSPPVLQTVEPKNPYVIQAGVYVGPLQAGRLAKSLSKAGFKAKVEKQKKKQGGTWYVVLMGPFNGSTQLQKAKKHLKNKYAINKPILKKVAPPSPKT